MILSQDGTWVHNNSEGTKTMFLEIYGEKLDQRAYKTVKNAPVGSLVVHSFGW